MFNPDMPGKLIPPGMTGKVVKIVIQGYADKRPFVFYGILLDENDWDLHVRIQGVVSVFRKEYISKLEFVDPEDINPDVRIKAGETGRVFYQDDGDRVKNCFGRLSETDEYVRVMQDNGKERMILKCSILRVSYPDKQCEKKDGADNRVIQGKKSNAFSYSRWWSNENVNEVKD